MDFARDIAWVLAASFIVAVFFFAAAWIWIAMIGGFWGVR